MAGFPKGKDKRGEVAKRPMPGIPLDINVVEQLIVKYTGNVSAVADAMGTCRGTVRNVIDRHPHLQDLLKQQRERQLDELEKTVFQDAIETRDTALRCFVLKTQGRHRGWDQSEAQNAAKDIATAAFDYILNKSSNQQ